MKKIIILWIFLISISINTYSLPYGSEIYGCGLYSIGCEVVKPIPTPSGGAPSGGLREDAKPALAEAIRKNQTPSCSEGNQYLDGACYPCSSNGFLFKRPDGSVVCIKCYEGFEYDGNGGCQQMAVKVNETRFDFMEMGSRISPENPYVGFTILLLPTLGLLYWLYTRFEYAKKYEEQKKKEEEKQEEEQKEI